MKIGTSDISKIYLGSTEVTKVYLGTTEIYSASVTPTPEPSTSDTLVLMHFDASTNVAAADLATGVSVVADTGMPAAIDTADFKFGTGSLASGNKSAADITITLPETEPSVWTAECWVKGNASKGNATFSNLTKDDSEIYNGFALRYAYAKGTVTVRTANKASTLTSNALSATVSGEKEWMHIALVKLADGTMWAGFAGALMQVTEIPGWNNTFYIGLNRNDSSIFYPCSVDEFRISKTNTLKDFDTTNLTYTVPTEAFTFTGSSSDGGNTGGETTENTAWEITGQGITVYTKAGVEIKNTADLGDKFTYDTAKSIVPSLVYTDSSCTTEADLKGDGSPTFVLNYNGTPTLICIDSTNNIYMFGTVTQVSGGSSTTPTTQSNPVAYIDGGFNIPAGVYTETTGDKRIVTLENTVTLTCSDVGNLYIVVKTGEPNFVINTKITGEEAETMMFLGRLYQSDFSGLVFEANTDISYSKS